jgi:hypothetical protein
LKQIQVFDGPIDCVLDKLKLIEVTVEAVAKGHVEDGVIQKVSAANDDEAGCTRRTVDGAKVG